MHADLLGKIKHNGEVNSREFWKAARGEHRTTPINTLRKKDGSLTDSVESTVKRAAEYFDDLFKSKMEDKKKIKSLKKKINHALNEKFTKKEIRQHIKRLKNGKAVGPDGIPNEFLKAGGEKLETALEQLLNEIHEKEIIPSSWNDGLMNILYKGKGDITDMSNSRGITINNSMSKLFANMLNSRLTEFIEKIGLLGEFQNGFRKTRQANDNLFVLRNIIERGRITSGGSKGNVSLCFVDLKKAYDTIPRDLLWETMENLGFKGKFLNLIKALYGHDNIKIVVNGIESEPIYPKRGLKQGCPLSPVLFAIYMVELTNELHKTKEGLWIGGIVISILLFADDMVLIGKSRAAVERLLTKLIKCLEELGMEINTKKTEFLEVTPTSELPITVYATNGEVIGDILYSLKYKYLGVDIFVKNRMSIFKKKHEVMVHRAKSMAKTIKSMAARSCDTAWVATELWFKVAIPTILYACEITEISSKVMTTIEGLHGQMAAFVLGVDGNCSHAGILREVGWCSLSNLMFKRKLKIFHRLCAMEDTRLAKAVFNDCFSSIDGVSLP